MTRHQRLQIGLTIAAVLTAVMTAAGAEPLKIHMISGSKEYKSEASLGKLGDQLEKQHDMQVTASWVKDGAADLPGIEQIPEADVLVVFARRLKLPPEQMKVIRRHWESGKPVVGIRTASHAFGKEDNAVFDRQVLGGNYQGHYGDEEVEVGVAPNTNEHPIISGVGGIVSRKLYKAGPLAEDAIPLQVGTIKSRDVTHPVTWTHQYKGGRMFYTSLGVPEDFENKHFRSMLVHAILWTGGRR